MLVSCQIPSKLSTNAIYKELFLKYFKIVNLEGSKVLSSNSEITETRTMSHNAHMRNNSHNEIRFMQSFTRYLDILVE